MAGREASSYLLVLKHPLDTIEGIQEITGLEQPPVQLNDTSLIQAHLPEAPDGAVAVILSASAASAVQQWAERHRAVYTPQIVPLDARQADELVHAAQEIEWPCWIFLYGDSRDPIPAHQIRSVASLSNTSVISRQARILKYPDSSAMPLARTNVIMHKLRPAQDVLSRLRHDRSLRSRDFQVTYDDRFDGEITLDLEQWKSDVSDEEFIPMHRILRFTRKWDKMVIWDRKRRIDYLFSNEHAHNIYGSALEIKPEMAKDLLEYATRVVGSPQLLPCVVDFIDSEGGCTDGRIFQV